MSNQKGFDKQSQVENSLPPSRSYTAISHRVKSSPIMINDAIN